MAYNNGFPMGYQPLYIPQQYQQPQYQQPQMIQNPQQQTPQPQPNIIWVQNELEATNYPVAPNNAVTLWSTSEAVVYLKSADATGKPTLKTYDLVERTQSVSKAQVGPDGNVVEYAAKSDVVAIAGAVKGFGETLDGLRQEIDTMKGDLYGVAGRKRGSARKREDEEE